MSDLPVLGIPHSDGSHEMRSERRAVEEAGDWFIDFGKADPAGVLAECEYHEVRALEVRRKDHRAT
jgi:hypothetical protein